MMTRKDLWGGVLICDFVGLGLQEQFLFFPALGFEGSSSAIAR